MKRRLSFVLGALVIVVAIGVSAVVAVAQGSPTATPTSTTTAAPAKLTFGIGDEIAQAQTTPVYTAAPVDMVTSWYNGPSDLTWMSGYANTNQMSDLYGQGKSQELIVWLYNEPQYAISAQFQTDIKKLVELYKGNGPNYGPLYVVLFTEFETYSSDPAYTAQLMTAYTNAVSVIHSTYSQAKVALGFGGYGWGASYPVRNLAPEQAAINDSDFIAMQAMQACTHETALEDQIRLGVKQMSQYHKPIMISHFKIWAPTSPPTPTSCATNAFSKFERDMFSDSSLDTLTKEGLFAWGFMHDKYILNSSPAQTTAIADIQRHGVSSPAALAPATTASSTG